MLTKKEILKGKFRFVHDWYSPRSINNPYYIDYKIERISYANKTKNAWFDYFKPSTLPHYPTAEMLTKAIKRELKKIDEFKAKKKSSKR